MKIGIQQYSAIMILSRVGAAVRSAFFQTASRRRPASSSGLFTSRTGCRDTMAIARHRRQEFDPLHGLSTRLYASSASWSSQEEDVLSMENLYKEWTLEEDEKLWKHRNESIGVLAARLGRGLRGVQARLDKLKDVDSSAYQRLFVQPNNKASGGGASNENGGEQVKDKRVPAGEVIRRIQWDYQLDENDFIVLHYDRMSNDIIESPFTAPNRDIAGKATQLIDALPEHRIMGIKFKERIVWDREERLDLIFGTPGIAEIMHGYDEWWRRRQEEKELNRLRQSEVTLRLQKALGPENFNALKALSSSLHTASQESAMVGKKEVEDYVENAQNIFRNVRSDPTVSSDPLFIPMSDYDALDMLSELVALMPEKSTRETVLTEISTAMKIAEGKKPPVIKKELPQISEDDLTETFVRGSGPGGQKINKTSNRVMLVHKPTQVRVEVQETRSLQQNRKIARKRLREKLDEFLNGKQSRASVAATKASSKKAKAKARAKARQRRKQEAKKEGDIDS